MKSEFLKVTGTSRISCLKLNCPSEQRARDGFACWVHLTFITWKLCAFKASGLAIWGLQRLKYPRFQTMSAGFGQKSLSALAYSEYPSEDSDTELTSMARAYASESETSIFLFIRGQRSKNEPNLLSENTKEHKHTSTRWIRMTLAPQKNKVPFSHTAIVEWKSAECNKSRKVCSWHSVAVQLMFCHSQPSQKQ